MGHNRLGVLPKSSHWREVARLIALGPAESDRLALAAEDIANDLDFKSSSQLGAGRLPRVVQRQAALRAPEASDSTPCSRPKVVIEMWRNEYNQLHPPLVPRDTRTGTGGRDGQVQKEGALTLQMV